MEDPPCLSVLYPQHPLKPLSCSPHPQPSDLKPSTSCSSPSSYRIPPDPVIPPPDPLLRPSVLACPPPDPLLRRPDLASCLSVPVGSSPGSFHLSDPAGLASFPPLPAPWSSFSVSPAVQQCSQPITLPSSYVVPPPAHQAPAAPAPQPAAPPPPVPASFPPVPQYPAAAPPLALSSPGCSHVGSPPVRSFAPAAATLSAALPPASQAPPPLTQPPLERSYAQVASGSRGSGFVRAHARDIEAFARLPRSGINIISGSREGLPSFSFVAADLPKIEHLYANALVMKFFGGRPSLEKSHKEISSWGIANPFSIGPLSSRAFLLRFHDENDLLKVLTRPSSTLITFPFKIFRWHTLCHIKEDSCMAPVWVSLPKLPLHCFIPEFLESVANRIGRFLCLDKATATLARPSAARMCVELDLRKPPPQFIWVGLFAGFKQPVIYEKLPKFCNICHVQGHSSVQCSKNPLDTPKTQHPSRSSVVQISTPAARHNANHHLSAFTQDKSTSGPTSLTPQVSQVSSSPSGVAPLPLSAPIHPPSHPAIPAAALPPPLPVPQSTNRHPSLSHQRLPASQLLQSATPSSSPLSSLEQLTLLPQSAAGPSSWSTQSYSSIVSTIAVSSPASVPPQFLAVQPQPQAPQDPAAAPTPSPSLPAPTQPTQAQSTYQLSQASSLLPTHNCFPPIKLMPSPRSSPVRPYVAAAPPVAAPPLHHPPLQQPPPSSSKARSKHKKSVSFMPQQSNIEANQVLWDVVNRHIAQINHNRSSPHEGTSNSVCALAEPPDPSSFMDSDSGASVDTVFPPNSPMANSNEDENPFPFPPQSYGSEGEDTNVELISLQGHISDNAFYQRPKSSKRNKRHPDGPLKVQLRARRGSSSLHR